MTEAPFLSKPSPEDTLYLYLAVFEQAVSAVLVKEEQKLQKPVYYVRKAHKIEVLTDQPLRNILYSLKASGRLIKWKIELGEFDIKYKPRTAIKAQALADFWSNLDFPTTNNEAEYEALITGLGLARVVRAENLKVCGDSRLVVAQVNGEFEDNDGTMAKYQRVVKGILTQFDECLVLFSVLSENCRCWRCSSFSGDDIDEGRRRKAEELPGKCLGMKSQKNGIEITRFGRVLLAGKTTDVVAGGCFSSTRFQPGNRLGFDLENPNPETCYADGPVRALHPDYMLRERLRQIHRVSSQQLTDLRQQDMSAEAAYRRAMGLTEAVLEALQEELSHNRRCWRCSSFFGDDIDEGRRRKAEELPGKCLGMKSQKNGIEITRFGRVLLAGKTTGVVAGGCSSSTRVRPEFREYCDDNSIELRFTSIAHPQANGKAEVVKRIILDGLKKRVECSKNTWVDELLPIIWGYRTTYKVTTEATPIMQAYGAESVVPLEITHGSPRIKAYEPETNEEGMRLALDLIDEGDLVLWKIEASGVGEKGKLAPNWEGPYKVRKTLG
ncbi:uncharacterized protein LOC141690540 [Apium graveolens]|uniref:uncharacterized protein LOC141690540 n=1 Tax=Apium graveolens TaxID=4045 RepID=UPI003D7A0F22